jgi:hypothetical protein
MEFHTAGKADISRAVGQPKELAVLPGQKAAKLSRMQRGGHENNLISLD